MAKLTGPFFSLKASGQLGKTIVAFPWKGVNALRTYVIPANPKSDAQKLQRGYFGDAVDEWHTALYNAFDVAAWNRYAGILAQIMSGFNAMIKTFVDEAILLNTWEGLFRVSILTPLATSFGVQCYAKVGTLVPTVHYGTSKTFMPDTADMTHEGGQRYVVSLTELTKNTLYYFYIDVGTSASDYGRTGIYSVRTLAS